MSKRERVDMKALMNLTADTAVPMREAVQRTPKEAEPGRGDAPIPTPAPQARTHEPKPLNFKVPSAFTAAISIW